MEPNKLNLVEIPLSTYLIAKGIAFVWKLTDGLAIGAGIAITIKYLGA